MRLWSKRSASPRTIRSSGATSDGRRTRQRFLPRLELLEARDVPSAILFQDPNTLQSAPIDGIRFATGNAVSVSGTNIAVGSLVTTYYQANIAGLYDSGSPQFSQLAGALLNDNTFTSSHSFLTAVLGVTEQVTSLTAPDANGIVTATFALAPAAPVNYLDLYVNTTGLGNNSAGTGFNAPATSTDIMHAKVTGIASSFSEDPTGTHLVPFNISGNPSPSYLSGAPSQSVGKSGAPGPDQPGSGQFDITAQILSADPNWFPTLNPGSQIALIIPTGNLRDNFASIGPAARFALGTGGSPVFYTPNPGNVNALPVLAGGTGTDIVMQVDASAGFLVTPSINTSQQPASATVGSSIADQATVTGLVSPDSGDTVTFNLYSSATTQNSSTLLFSDTETLTVSGGTGTATSAGYTATATGTDYWVATFNGDSNNSSVTSGSTAEPVTITPNTPVINTSQQPASAVVGSSIADKATVTGLVFPSSGDTVTFKLYNNSTASGTPLFTDTETLTISGGTGTATSAGYTATATGTDYWVATFNGDSNNNAVTSGTALEPVTITPNTPVINTSQQPASAVVGSSIADQATVTGLVFPSSGDTVTFKLYSNSTATGTPLFTDTETLTISGGTGTATSAGYTATATGTDYWVATFNGDSNNNAVTSGTALEPVTITPNTPLINTSQQPASAVVGSSIADKATVTGLVFPSSGDTVTFRLYSNSTATGTPLFTDTETLTISGGTGTATSAGYTATATGTDYWVATFNGDSNNNAVTSGTALEPVTITPNTPVINTSQQPASAVVGSSIADQATVTGLVFPSSGDTVTFKLYSNSTATGTPLFTDTETLTISGGTGTATSAGYTATATGTDYWVATFNGDSNNNAVTSGTALEPVTITPNTPLINTSQQPASAVVGSSIADKATVTGLVFPSSGDTVTFRLYSNSTATGTPLFTDTETLTISGGTGTATSAGYTATATGTDYWVATFNGDSNNNAVTSGTALEPVTITPNTPVINTSQQPASAVVGSSIADKATVTGLVFPSSGDTVTFKLYSNSTATGTPLFTDTETLTISGGTGTATSAGYTATATGTDYWVATFNGDSNNNAVTSGTALEPVTITPNTPVINTSQQPASAVVGSSIADQATVTGLVFPSSGDTVTFKLYSNSTATGTPLFTDTETLTISGGTGTATSAGYTATATGTDYWVATFNGDSNNNAVTSGTALEPVTITPNTPLINTSQQPASAVVGSSIADKATVTGLVFPSSGDTVTFKLYSSATTQNSSTLLFSNTQTLTVSGTSGTATSVGYTATATGTDYWVATFNGDSNNNAVTSGSTAEPVTIVDEFITITPSTATNPAGVPHTFTATVYQNLGGSSGWTAVGSGVAVVVTLTSSNGATITSPSPSPSGTTATTDSFNLTTNSSGQVAVTFTSSTPGTVTGSASTSFTVSGVTSTRTTGDGYVDGSVGDSPNAVKYFITFTTTTGPTVVIGSGNSLSDSATLSGGNNPGGTITFKLYAPTDTTYSSPVYTSSAITVSGAGTYGGASKVSFLPTTTGNYQWVAYYSGDPNNPALNSGNGNEPETVKPASPGISTTPGGPVTLNSISIGGTKFLDLTGNGFSSDDTRQGGVTINLFQETNNTAGLQTGSGGDTLVASTTTAIDGTFNFSNLSPGTYYVQEAVPSGYLQTGGGPNGSAGNTYYTVVATSGHSYAGYNFDDFQVPMCQPTCVYYTVTPPGGCPQTFTTLSGHTVQGATVTVTFTVAPGMNDQLTLVSYIAPGPSFSNSTAYQQAIYQVATGTFTAGTFSLTVQIPNTYYQIDFVCGLAIDQLEPNQNNNAYGPDSANILYHAEGRFIDSDGGGTTAPSSSQLNSKVPSTPSPTTTGSATAPLTDSATLSGGFSPVGTVTFYLFAPGVTPNSNNSNNVYKDTVTVSGNATYTTSQGNNPGGYVPTQTGTYQWVVVYSGDSNNNGTSSPFGSEPETASLPVSTISGTKFLDVTGNGFSSDDTGLGGVTINLYQESNNSAGLQLASGGDKLVTSTKTANDGTYSFANLTAGTYYVQEVVPANTLQTGGGPNTTSDGNTYYTVTVPPPSGQSLSGNNFDDFQMICNPSEFTNICYTVTAPNGSVTHPSSLSGNVPQGSTVTVNFTWNGTESGDHATLVSYVAPNGNFDTSNLQQQMIFEQSTVSLVPGTKNYTLTVTVPNCYFQLDFVCGLAIDHLATNPNIYYHAQNRFIDGTQGGSQTCAPSSISGTVFHDINGDCVQQSGEAGIKNVTITLTGHDFTGATVSRSTVTDNNGAYSFSGLNASDVNGYTITESQPSGYTHEGQMVGSTGGTTGNHTITTFLNTNTSSTGNNFCEVKGSSISGTKYLDLTGNGFSADDTPLGGVTINLYKDVNGNGVLDTNTDPLVSSTVTSNASGQVGTYSFDGLDPATYFVQEVVPSGYVRTGPALSSYYTVCVTSGSSTPNQNFDDFQIPSCPISNISYKDKTPSGTVTTGTSLSGLTHPGDTVTVTFTVGGSANAVVTLVSYTSVASFDLTQQHMYQDDTETLAPGQHTLTVRIPNTYYQIDFVCGPAIDPFGPSGSNITYHGEQRFIDADHGGSQTNPPVTHGDFATIGFWHNANGQALINSLNGGSTSTALASWLSANFPNLSAALVSAYGKAVTTNSDVAAAYLKFYGSSSQATNTQMLATALAVYVTNTKLAGGNMAAANGFNTSLLGTGIDTWNVGSNGSALGLTNGNSYLVMQLLQYVDGKFALNSSQSSAANAIFTAINNGGGLSQLAQGSTAADDVGQYLFAIGIHGHISVAVTPLQGDQAAEQAAIDNVIATLNTDLSGLNIALVEVDSSQADSADVNIQVADTSPIGGASDGVLGCYTPGGSVILLGGWNWYLGSDPSGIASNQYDFQTVLTHEIGHALGLGESTDPSSVMYLYLGQGQTNRGLTADNVSQIQSEVPTGSDPMLAAGTPWKSDEEGSASSEVSPSDELTQTQASAVAQASLPAIRALAVNATTESGNALSSGIHPIMVTVPSFTAGTPGIRQALTVSLPTPNGANPIILPQQTSVRLTQEDGTASGVFFEDDFLAAPTQNFDVPVVVPAFTGRRELSTFAVEQPATSSVAVLTPAATATETTQDWSPLCDAYFAAYQEETLVSEAQSSLFADTIPAGESFLAAASLAFLFHGARNERTERDRKHNVTLPRK